MWKITMTKTPRECKKRSDKKWNKNEYSESFLNVWKELERIDIKYKELAILKGNLQKMIKEQNSLDVVLNECETNEENRAALMIQMGKLKEMNSKLEEIFKEIEKSIKEREEEIKEIEEVLLMINLIKKS